MREFGELLVELSALLFFRHNICMGESDAVYYPSDVERRGSGDI